MIHRTDTAPGSAPDVEPSARVNPATAPSPGAPDAHNPSGRRFFGQPGPLANIFSVEMWERFSFYGMQAMLVYYMYWSVADGGLGIDRAVATGIVGAYGGMVYVFCILGGWVADRLIGSEKTLFFSAIGIMLGHIALALVPGVPGLILGLFLVAIGSGGLKANAANIVGSLYAKGDRARDAGFSIFYMGVNIGALIGPLLTGWARDMWGFHVGFGLAALWTRLGNRQPSTPVKFGIGILLIGLAFLLFIPMAGVASVPLLWLTLILFVMTLGELMVSPVGLSLSTKLAPAAFPVMTVALFNLAVALGSALAGSLAGSYSEQNEAGYFGVIGAVTVGVGLLMLLLAPAIRRGMRGVR